MTSAPKGHPPALLPGLAARAVLSIDCARPAALARFWQRLVGGDLGVSPDGDTALHGGLLDLDLIRVTEAKAAKNRLHLDLGSTDQAAAVRGALALGATLADGVFAGGSWQVLRDPEGNEFCILAPRG